MRIASTASARIQTARLGLQPSKPEQRVEIGRRLTDRCADLSRRRQQPIDLDGTTRFDVLEHRSLEGTEFARHEIALLGTLRDIATDPRADRRSLAHHGETEAVHQWIV